MRTLRFCFWLSVLTATQALYAQPPAVGRLLVSDESLEDPNFAQSVMLILIHENGSSAAIFLNRPTWVDPGEAFPDVSGFDAYTDALYLGGPVAPEQLLIVFEYDGAPPVGAGNLFGNVYYSATPDILDRLDLAAADAPRLRVYAGHAQWAADQLMREINAGNWRVLPGTFDAVFAEDPTELWGRLRADRDDVTAALH